MKSDIGCMLAGLKNMYGKEEVFFVSIGGLLVGSSITHGEMISTISAMIMKAVEIAAGICQTNIPVYSSTSKLIIASASPQAILIYQKNRTNTGLRKERSRWEIIEDMLKVLLEEKKPKKTKIMQRACLNWKDFQRYFDFLLEEGFIAKCDNPEPGSYEITEKGRELLKRLKEVDDLLD